MQAPTMFETAQVARDTFALQSYLPVPGAGVLPVNTFVIRGEQPVLVDTGVGALREPFMRALSAVIDPAELRWIWITHADADHVGNLAAVLEAAPNARLVTTFLGMGKMGMQGLATDRSYLLNPGQELDIGDRTLRAFSPPVYDAPETTGLFDSESGALFSADTFGALMAEPAETAASIAGDALKQGMLAWARVDSPWLDMVGETQFAAKLAVIREFKPRTLLSTHLPAAGADMLDVLLANVDAARHAPAFVGPDQAALEQMLAVA
jgi:glyoxylase-like metal-dependent hydrolase (beta-lactamase superfamily II)